MKKFVGMVLGVAIVALASGCASSVSGSHVIYGVVADVDSNPVPGAIVTSDPPSASVSTDKDGRYMIKGVKAGEYTLRASKMGYVSTPAKIAVRSLDFVQADIRLVPEEMIPSASPQVYVEPPAAPQAEPAPAAEQPQAGEEKENSGKAWWEKK